MHPLLEYQLGLTRRHFFGRLATGIGTAALASLLNPAVRASSAEAGRKSGLPGLPHVAPKAKRVIYLFMAGGPSQLELWDHKPRLESLHHSELPDSIRMGQRITTMTSGQQSFPVVRPIFKFAQHGQGGAWASELIPHMASIADDLCIVKTVHTEAINHDPAITFIQTGFQQPGRPCFGAWLDYGLGSANENLPGFIVMISSGKESDQPLYTRLWSSGFLPSEHQGVQFRGGADPVLYLSNPPGVSAAGRRRLLDRLAELNARQLDLVGDPEIQTRIAQYEMSFRMQTSVPELVDLSREPEAVLALYGPEVKKPGSFAYHCLLARRMAERGVRFIQLYHRGWDQHGNLPRRIREQCADAGVYDVVVSSPYGSVTSQSVTLSVQVDTTPPSLESAAGKRSFTGVRVVFSESLDPVSAQTASNYQLSGGVTVTSATLASPAGTPGDHLVDLVTSPQTPGATYTLTVSGVKDQSLPGNPVAAGSTATFTAWGLAQGVLLFEHYDNLSGANDAAITAALQDPRVKAQEPTTLTFIFREFNTRSAFPTDAHENYLARITGWITPTETADYDFFLRADDAARLYLSTTEAIPDPATATPIAQETDCCDAFQEPWVANDDGVTYPTTTAPIRLQAGQRYGVLALLKEAGGGDYLMVAWRKTSDFTPANELPYLPGQYLSGLVDPAVELRFVQQPTDQLRVLPFGGTEDFAEGDGGYMVENSDPEPPGPWAYDAANGQWVASTGNDACGDPNYSLLTSPAYLMPQTGQLTLSFDHRYAFEGDLYDGGQVRISVNRGPFTAVPPENFSANGYAAGLLIGHGILDGQPGFNGQSPGYAAGTFITSTAVLGTFNQNDKIAVQFVAGWDECTTGTVPNWVIKRLQLVPAPPTKASTFRSKAEASLRSTPLRVHYQWQRDDGAGFVDIAPPSSTGPSFSLYPVAADFQARFRVVASVPGRSMASDVVRLVTELGPPTIAISKTGATLTLQFTGTLQSATQVTGPYTDVAGAQSPYTISNPGTMGFFRSVR